MRAPPALSSTHRSCYKAQSRTTATMTMQSEWRVIRAAVKRTSIALQENEANNVKISSTR
uniref:Uncharacterized protein n=1 Tax=Peronospora matthiolae TaxID=2874970 RepID=A0AAV1URU7_9STRA